MTKAEKIDKINQWQAATFVHKLTCGKNSSHKPLVPVIDFDEVILECPDCDYIQERIPEVVLTCDLEQTKKDLIAQGFIV
jgi:hypothetical protein